MVDATTIGEKLARMRSRSGMSMEEVAKAGGWSGRSSMQRYFSAEYNPLFLPMDVAQRLMKAFQGKEDETTYISELFTLAGAPSDAAKGVFSVRDQVGSIVSLARDVPVYGTALGGEAKFNDIDGTGSLSVEQAELDQSEILGYLRRPPALEGRKDVYGVYISGASMYPRFNDGEAVFVDPKRPPMNGDDIIIQLCSPDPHDGDRVTAVLIKRLVRRTASYLELAQFNPALTFRIESRLVKSIHRIVPPGELFS